LNPVCNRQAQNRGTEEYRTAEVATAVFGY
jgi:hypothetical protein